MLVYAENILSTKAVQKSNPLEKHLVTDLLFNVYDHRLCYLTYEVVDLAGETIEMPGDRQLQNITVATSGMGAMHTPMTGNAYTEVGQNGVKQTYFVPWHEIESLDDDTLIYKGKERQISEPSGCYSYRSIKGMDVVTEKGEKIGRIKDLVIDRGRQQVVGFVLSEGVLKDMIHSTDKQVPLSGTPDFGEKVWRIE